MPTRSARLRRSTPMTETVDPQTRRAPAPGLAELAAELRERLAEVRRGGDDKARARHVERGKMLVRDRVDRLLDPGSPFLELSPLAAYDMYGGGNPFARILPRGGRAPGRAVGGGGGGGGARPPLRRRRPPGRGRRPRAGHRPVDRRHLAAWRWAGRR